MQKLDRHYLLGLSLAIASLLFLVLAIGALGIVGEGGRPDRLYVAVPAVALVGTVLARLRARGMASTMLATAVTQAVVSLVALALVLAGAEHFEGASVVDLVGISAMYVLLFVGSAWLFRKAGTA